MLKVMEQRLQYLDLYTDALLKCSDSTTVAHVCAFLKTLFTGVRLSVSLYVTFGSKIRGRKPRTGNQQAQMALDPGLPSMPVRACSHRLQYKSLLISVMRQRSSQRANVCRKCHSHASACALQKIPPCVSEHLPLPALCPCDPL